jgi:hypothetical protein
MPTIPNDVISAKSITRKVVRRLSVILSIITITAEVIKASNEV